MRRTWSFAVGSIVACAVLIGCSGEAPSRDAPASGGSGGSAPPASTGPGIAPTGTAGSVSIGPSGTIPTEMPDGSSASGCSGTSSMTEALHPVLQFLVDTSLSMLEKAPGGTQTKWDATRAALSSAVTDMAAGTGLGMIYYPNMLASRGVCLLRNTAVPIASLNDTVRAQALASLQSTKPTGMTPTHDAYVYALEGLKASTLPGDKYVVLVTDGAPTFSLNCVGNGLAEVDATPLIDEAARARAAGIKTFVIGSPGSESARAALSRMASAGGTAPSGCSDAGPVFCHFDMTTATDLSAALNAAVQAITGRVVSCNYPIPAPPAGMQLDYDLVNVQVSGSSGSHPVLRDSTNVPCADGWNYSADRREIVLCADTCTSVKSDPEARVDVVFGCKTMGVQIQ